jgi:hypothetical protein
MDRESVEESVAKILTALEERGYIAHPSYHDTLKLRASA